MSNHLPIHLLGLLRRFCATAALLMIPLFAACFLGGCSRLHQDHREMVYVSVRGSYLHDRVAPVSNRVCHVVNGQPLEVLEHGRRFLKVKTEKNEIGWIEDHAVIDSETYDAFARLAAQHKADPVAATATLKDDLAMHVLPGRETERFYLLPGDTSVELLARASAPKKASQARVPPPSSERPKGEDASSASGTAAEPPDMEDWWLARDSQGRVGWLLASRIYVNAPLDIAQYAENQRFVGCWMLTKVNDPDSDTPDHEKPEYLTVLAPLHYGLPYDFNEVRVFTWSLKHHRYETAFRLHPVQGFLPVHVFQQTTPKGTYPAFSFLIASDGAVKIDPTDGIMRPVAPRTIEYDMVDTRVQRIGPDTAKIPLMHEAGEKKQGPRERGKGTRKR